MARQYPCPIPGCQRNRLMTSPYGVCATHTELFEAITYYIKMGKKGAVQANQQAMRKGARPGERITPSGIILP